MGVIASSVIIMWPGTNASIPSGWSRVTDLDLRFTNYIPKTFFVIITFHSMTWSC